MRISVYDAIRRIITARSMPAGADIKIISLETGLPINRKKLIDVKAIRTPVSNMPDTMRVATFNKEVQKLIGAQVAAKVELCFNGKPVDGRLSLAKLS